jgi:NAD+ synthase/NAD+ synthase (glutamine-hydrolysing)
MVVFPELSVCGYPPRDLVEVPAFVARSRQVLEQLAAEFPDIAIIAGFPSPAASETGMTVMNSAALLRHGRIDFIQSKRLLPTYDVFDEMRTFAPATVQGLFCAGGQSIALTICEDAWNDKAFWSRRLYDCDPVDDLLRAGGKIVLNISASPFHVGKPEFRQTMLASIAQRHHVPVLLVNQVGGNDSLVFDGSSLALSPSGEIIAQAKSFEEDLILVDTTAMTGDIHEAVTGIEESAYRALVLGTRDYVHKCGFRKVVVGLSGGIDSALTAVIAVDALGAENVIGISMPSQYSSEGSITDARALAQNLGICFDVVPIREIFEAYRGALSKVFRGLAEDVTEENLQARARGGLLMAVANKFSALVLTTGNKSELGVGYCTLYGDMVGGLAVISDVPKTLVYRLARYVNSQRAFIPEASITKPPSAELRPEQKDSDSLPPYDVLDRILEEYVGNLKSAPEIAALTGFDEEVIRFVIGLIDRSEYKRQQAAPGIRISTKAFGVGRRFPTAAKHQV